MRQPIGESGLPSARTLAATTTDAARVRLTESEIDDLRLLLREVAAGHSSIEDPEFHRRAPLYAHELPRRLRAELLEFKYNEPASALLILSGFPIDQEKLGPTPRHWETERDGGRARDEAILLTLFGSVLGDCIGWTTQQDGRLVHDIFPIKGNEAEQLGTGSEQVLWWHVEDAFHPHRGDYLGMLCLRNPDRVPTTFAAAGSITLDPRHVAVLMEPHYTIRPDESHLSKNKARSREVDPMLASSYARIEEMNRGQQKVAVMFGDPAHPYLRLDPYFMDRLDDNPAAQEALEALIQAIDERLEDLILEAGDYCFIDNFQAVHGRRAFKARYDGQDRWMKRINLARDLRKSRTWRETAASRIFL